VFSVMMVLEFVLFLHSYLTWFKKKHRN
jgi:hypothetical protein